MEYYIVAADVSIKTQSQTFEKLRIDDRLAVYLTHRKKDSTFAPSLDIISDN